MSCQISTIEAYCKTPLASIRLLSLYIPSDVETMPAPGLGVYSATEPGLITGAAAIDIPFDRFSCSLISNPDTGTQAGDFWQHQIRLNIRRNRSEVGLWMLRMKNRQFHLLAEDWYGERMWFPYMRLASSRTVEERLSGRNGFTFTFSRRSNHPGIYLDANINAPLSSTTSWSESDGAWTDSDGEWVDSN